jgi:hypothetical protein
LVQRKTGGIPENDFFAHDHYSFAWLKGMKQKKRHKKIPVISILREKGITVESYNPLIRLKRIYNF